MGEWVSIINWAGGLGGTAVMAIGIIALHKGWIVHGRELKGAETEILRERGEREKAEERLMVSQEKLSEASVQLARAIGVADKMTKVAGEKRA